MSTGNTEKVCAVRYADIAGVWCERAKGHAGNHMDYEYDYPAVLVWTQDTESDKGTDTATDAESAESADPYADTRELPVEVALEAIVSVPSSAAVEAMAHTLCHYADENNPSQLLEAVKNMIQVNESYTAQALVRAISAYTVL